jgi:hypothetical protein
MTRSDLELANDFIHLWIALARERRARVSKQMPVASVPDEARIEIAM